MKKILVISDNDLLNQLYLINLQIYLGANVTMVKDFINAKKIIKELENFDLIISVAMIDENDVSGMCFDSLKASGLKIPLIIIGMPRRDLPNITVIQTSYNLQNLLRSVASALEITAQKMVEQEVPKFYPISVSYLNHLKQAPCMLYLEVKVSKEQFEYVLCSSKDSNISSLVKKLHQEGVPNLFVNSQDRLSIVNQISGVLTQIIRDTAGGTTIVAKSNAISAGFNFAASQMVENEEVVQEIVAVAETCAKAMDVVISEVDGIKELLKLLMSNPQGYIYTHSMLVAYVARHIIKNVSWGGDTHIDRINFMVFFHDLFLVPIYVKYPDASSEEDLMFNSALSNDEKEIVLNHARLAGEQLTKYKKCPSGIDLLIKQHHGMSTGVGFATDYSDNVSPLSKVFIIAESFVEIYLKDKKQNSKHKADLKSMTDALHEKYTKHTYRKIIDPLKTIRL